MIGKGLAPIITIHGDQDDVIPYSQSVRLHQALDKAGVINQLVTFRGRKHGNFKRGEWVQAYAAIKKFLAKNGVMNQKQ